MLTVEFTVLGIPCLGLNGGPQFKQSEAFSFQVATDNQDETDRYWNAIIEQWRAGKRRAVGARTAGASRGKSRRARSSEAMAAGGSEAKRAFVAMMTMRKIDVAAIEAARRG